MGREKSVEDRARAEKPGKKPTAPKMKKCPQCGKMFRADSNRRYCDYDCQQKHNIQAMKKRYAERNPKPERFCTVCGVLLPPETSRCVVTCSPECRIERARELKRLDRERRKERMEGGQRREPSK